MSCMIGEIRLNRHKRDGCRAYGQASTLLLGCLQLGGALLELTGTFITGGVVLSELVLKAGDVV